MSALRKQPEHGLKASIQQIRLAAEIFLDKLSRYRDSPGLSGCGGLFSGDRGSQFPEKSNLGNLLDGLGSGDNILNRMPNMQSEFSFNDLPVAAVQIPGQQARSRFTENYQRNDEELKAMFHEIDANNDGRLTEDELRAYAAKRGLPTTYVREFLDEARYGWRSLRMPWESYKTQSGMALASLNSSSREQMQTSSYGGTSGGIRWPFRIRPFDDVVDFQVFKSFVEAKDGALRDSFNRIDSNKDGEITVLDLEKGVKQVRVLCSRTGDYYPVKRKCVTKMMRKMQKGRSSTISFQEFRDFFTLLPSSEYLLDYWLDASCCASGLDFGSNVQVLTRAKEASEVRGSVGSKGSAWNHLLAGGLAGAVSRTVTAPLETLRLRMMLSPTHNLRTATKAILQNQGWRAFFKGNFTNVVRSAPQKAIDFFAFEAYKTFLRRNGSQSENMQVVAAGAMAGATSTLLLYPLDVVRSRLTVQNGLQYKGILDALIKIPQNEGFFALYRGLRPSILSIIPEAAITYGCFDVLKSTYKKVMNKEEVGVLPALVCGVTSAFTGQLVAYPLELVARRSQVGGSCHSMGGGGASLQQIVAKEGIRGLYRGIVPASIKVIPMAIVSFGVYEATKQSLLWLSDWEEKRQLEETALEEERSMRTLVFQVDAVHGEACKKVL